MDLWFSHRNQHVVNFEIPPFSCIRSVVHLVHRILLLVAAEFIINKLQRFEQFKGRDLNSHAPSIGTYARMLSAFNTAFENNMGNLLSAEQLATILKERIHPSNR